VIKFQLISRRKPGDTQEKYFYEWGIIHVALMITTPSVMRTFKRYAQHFTVNGVDGGRLLYPLSDMAWDNFADHWLERPEDNLVPFESDDYMQRMHPHNFGDSNFVIEYLTETLRDEAPGFEPGGVKLIHVVRSRPGLSAREFAAAWRERHAAALLAAGDTRPGRLVQNLQAEVDKEDFKGTLFELAGVGGYAGIEELWFEDLDALLKFTQDPGVCVAVLAEDAPVDPARSFSMVVTERVVYDYALGDESSPAPAVLDPGSLEARVDAQRYADWNVPGWEQRARESV
jgi:hypothetical protein